MSNEPQSPIGDVIRSTVAGARASRINLADIDPADRILAAATLVVLAAVIVLFKPPKDGQGSAARRAGAAVWARRSWWVD